MMYDLRKIQQTCSFNNSMIIPSDRVSKIDKNKHNRSCATLKLHDSLCEECIKV